MQSHPSFRSSDDETSRDSGFMDLEQEQAELIMQTEFTTAQMDFSFSSINTSREMTLCEKLELDKLMLEDGKPSIQIQLRRSTRKPLSDLNLNSNLHDDSPKSRRALFKSIPLQRNATIANIGMRRKRSTIEDNGCSKRLKLDVLEVDVGTEAMDIPCTSKNEAVLPHPARTRLSLTRTNSMPVFDRNQENIEPPMMEIETQWHLETVTCRADSTAFRRISADTLYGLLTSMTDQQFNSKYILIDCRYPFEYDGGHIRNAINLYDPLCCEEFFYPSDEQQRKEVHSRIPIFYCEFSQHRGPQMANVLRSKDRLRNMHHYPRVDFREMYVVNEGYRNFYHFINAKNITSVCEPHSYIAMVDRRFTEHLKKFDFHKSRSGCTSMKKSRTNSRLHQFHRQLSADGVDSSPSSLRPTPRRNLFAVIEQLSPLSQSPTSSSNSEPNSNQPPVKPPQFS